MDVKDELVNRGYSLVAGSSTYSKVFRNLVDKHVLFMVSVDFLHNQLYLDHHACTNLEQDVSFTWSGELSTIVALEDFAYYL